MCDPVLASPATDSHALCWAVTRWLRDNLCGLTVQLRVAKKTKQQYVSRVTKLYEHVLISEVIEGDVRRWNQWATGGLGEYAKQLILDDDVDGYLQSLRCRVSPSR